MIEKIIPALGISFCAFCVHEFMCHFFFGGGKAANIFTKILAIIDFFILICSAPVSIIIFMHDNRMKALHEKEFRKEREPYESMMERKYQEVCKESDSLRLSLLDERERSFVESCERYKDGYYDGYSDCADDCAEIFSLPQGDRTVFLSNCRRKAIAYCKSLDEQTK